MFAAKRGAAAVVAKAHKSPTLEVSTSKHEANKNSANGNFVDAEFAGDNLSTSKKVRKPTSLIPLPVTDQC